LENNIDAGNNIAVGVQSLYNNNSGENNLAIGSSAMLKNTIGSDNTAIGFNSLYNDISGNKNVAIGSNAGYNLTDGSNNIIIGFNAQPSDKTVSNEITLGNNSVGALRCKVTTITGISDVRDKKDIVSLENGLEFVSKLNPVSFMWNMRDGGKVDIPSHGFIAQELQQVQKDTGLTVPDLVYESNPDRLEAGYSTLLPITVKAIQELKIEVANLKAEIAFLKSSRV